ncbi:MULTISPECIES: A24 family peptidase [unclassified Granulicatella]|uniref:prepilin peptidase n=1 Tax=unclassified Granulicatella TaxID=2630493 RepID=UPI00107472B3|nr:MULTISPECIES: A24 family peptidase [unclassified Granulicatella]MBF0780340.1 prepilin peptidase [Granulicatella sp. 19428wC4_WM01]TFU95519.1 prepilin peptidase [Granulicatella sp. WM01]
MTFIIGTILASFTQLIAHRYPNTPFSTKRSYCNHCKTPLQWFSLLPILSFLCTKGKCSKCKHSIPAYYPLFECAGGLLSHYLPLNHINWLIVGLALFFMAQIDCEHYIVPNSWQLCYAFVAVLYQTPSYIQLLIIILIWTIYIVLDSIYPYHIGGADVKIILITYLLLGTIHTLFIVLFSCLCAILFILLKNMQKKEIPFIPFLFLGWFIHYFINFSTI